MEIKLLSLLILWVLTLSEASPQRGLNSIQQASSKGKQGEDPKQAKIMKQINKVNEDGSYTFGYEADDGSFRVETRSKDGVVKGKYGYVDANGELKVMEYTAGEKTESSKDAQDEEDEIPAPRYLSRQSKSTPSLALPPPQRRADQSFAAQTQSEKVSGDEEKDDDDEPEDDAPPKDVNNGQYFRAIPSASPSPGPLGPTSGPRYVPSHQIGQQQYAQGFSTLPREYAPQQYAPGQGFQGPQSYEPQSQGPPGQLGQSIPISGQSLPSPYSGQFEEDSYPQYQPGRPSPNVQLQFRGSPPDERGQGPSVLGQGQAPQQYFPQGGQRQEYEGFSPVRGGGPSREQEQEQRYVPNVDLDGYSEDADEDGFVDEPPNTLSSDPSNRETSAQAQEKQGVAVRPGGGVGRAQDAYRPQVLGPQGILQGGQVNLGGQFGGPGGRQNFGQQQGRPFLGQGQGPQQQLPQLTEEQIQQLFAQQQGFQGQGGFGQQQQGQGFPGQGFPGQGQQFQGFSPQQQFLGGGINQRPVTNQQQFIPQQQLQGQLQGQYQGQGPSDDGDDQNQYTGFPQQQFIPQQGQGQQGQYLQGQGGFPGSFPQQGFQGFPPQGFSPQGGFQGQSGQGSPQFGGQLSRPQQGGFQSQGIPFDFNPYGGLPGSTQGFPGQFQGQGFPQGQGNFQGQGQQQQPLSREQFAALQASGRFPGQGQGQIQGFAPGRFSGNGGPQQYFGGPGPQSQSISLPNPISVQLGGGQPRPVTPAGGSTRAQEGQSQSLGGGVFGGEENKQVSSGKETSSAKSSN